MNGHASRPRQPRIFQARGGYGSLPAFDTELKRCSSPSILLPRHRLFAWRNSEDNAVLLEEHGSLTLCFSGRVHGQRQRIVLLRCGGRWRPDGDAFQKTFRREPSLHIFPAHSRSLARCLSRALRHVDVLLHPMGALRVWVSKQKISLRLRPSATPARNDRMPGTPVHGRDFFFGASTESTSRPWERGTLASLRAGVSREQSGQIQTGETQWHSTKIT